MQNYLKEKVLRCTPNGKITAIEARTMHQIVDDCIESLNSNDSAMVKCTRLIATAQVCQQNKYYQTALDLLDRVGKIAMHHHCCTRRYSCQAYHYQAARLIDEIRQITAPGEYKVSEYASAVYEYMSELDDYEYCHLGIDNEERFDRINRYGVRHGIINNDRHESN